MTETNTNRRILVVEDDEAVRGLVSRYLRRRGFEVTDVGDADAVLLETQREEHYDLVLTDIHLDGVFSGVDLMEILLAHSPLRPVIIMTGDRNSTLAQDALKKGAAGYLLKPFELFELDAVVREVLFRVELMEATRSGPGAHGDEAEGMLPAPWLRLTDARSGAGVGHSYRVSQIADLLASHLPGVLSTSDRRALELAAKAHELGRVSDTPESSAAATPAGAWARDWEGGAALAVRTSQLLAQIGLPPDVVRAARGLFERWDGTGGPDALSGDSIPITAQVLTVADAVDHGAAAAAATGFDWNDAVAFANDAVLASAGSVYSPAVARALEDCRPLIEALWVLNHEPERDEPLPFISD